MSNKLRRKLQGRRAKQRKLSKQIIEFGASHALKPDETARLELSRISKAEASHELKLSAPADGTHIPYFGVDGKRTKHFRVRLDDYASFVEPIRYLAPKDSGVHVYFPPLVDWAKIVDDTSIPLAVTEGELKAAACTAAGIPCIGIPGISCWHGTKHELVLLPELNDIAWEGREVTVIPDSNIETNFNVKREAYRLADALTDAGAQIVKVLHLSGRDDGKKAGVDDYLLTDTPKQLEALIANTPPCDRSRVFRELDKQYIYVLDPSMVVKDTPQGVVVYTPRVFKEEVEVSRRATVVDSKGNPRLVSAAKLWFESPSRPAVERLTYRPGAPYITNANELNLWRGLGCDPHKGDTQPWEKLLARLLPEDREREWVEDWFAAPLQKPGLKLKTAVVLWSLQRQIGKTLLGSTVGRMHGAQNYSAIEQKDLDSPFNEWLVQKTFILGNEICGAKDSRALTDTLKTIITDESVRVNRKFQPTYTLPNVANFLFTSNRQNAIFVDSHEVRYAIFECKAGPLPLQFYKNFVRWRNEEGGLSAILYRLQHRNLSRFEPNGGAPETEARKAMVEAGGSDVQNWCRELRNNTDTALTKHGAVSTTPGELFTTKELLDIFDPRKKSKVTEKGIATALREEGFAQVSTAQVRIPGTDWKLRLWVVRDAERIAKMSPGQIAKLYADRPDVKAKIVMAPKLQKYAAGRGK
jgi:hypothetical protein